MVVVSAQRSGYFEAGQRYGELSLRFRTKFSDTSWASQTEALYYGVTYSWTHPAKDGISPLRSVRTHARTRGDKETSTIAANILCVLEFDLIPIPQLVDKIIEYHHSMRAWGQGFNLGLLHPISYIVVKCSGKHADLFPAVSEADACISSFRREVNSASLLLQWSHLAVMWCYFIFGEFDEAVRAAQFCSFVLEHPHGLGDATMGCLCDYLLTIARLRLNRGNAGLIWRARKRIKQFRCWVDLCPVNFLGKLYLVEAEWASLWGNDKKAHRKYVSSISLFKDHGSYQYTAVATELAGKHFLRIRNRTEGERFLRQAIGRYHEWGGHAKADHLATEAKRLYM